MLEIGGYIELDKYRLPMLHGDAIKLNCGRNALAYLIESKNIAKLYIPKFNCDCITYLCKRMNVDYDTYSIDKNFKPIFNSKLNKDEYLYLINYYGQISNEEIKVYKDKYKNLIVDNAQAYFQMPIEGIDTLYTCRKFFGVSDGAILYTDLLLNRELEVDESFSRMRFVLGRFERNASDFYLESSKNNDLFDVEPVKYMSKLTDNLLHGIDYDYVGQKRTTNFEYLNKVFKDINQLQLCTPRGAFMYPLLIANGAEIRKELQQKKIYIPILWPNVLNECSEDSIEYNYAKNILPLPCDQRYSEEEMEYMSKLILERMV